MEVWRGNPDYERLEEESAQAIAIEAQILEKLGSHPRIVPLILGVRNTSIEISEASHGGLQAYIGSNNAAIDTSLRWKWIVQVTKAVAFLYEQGVICSDLPLENLLVHGTVGPHVDSSPLLGLWLCDFGGPKCVELRVNGGKLPDGPFFDPRMPWVSTHATDIFSLGSIIYTILIGHRPHRECASPITLEDKAAYKTEANALFIGGKFPDLRKVGGREVIKGCWNHQYRTGKDVLEALESEMELLGIKMLD